MDSEQIANIKTDIENGRRLIIIESDDILTFGLCENNSNSFKEKVKELKYDLYKLNNKKVKIEVNAFYKKDGKYYWMHKN